MFTRRNSAFGSNERLGVLLIVEAAFVSVLAVTGVLLYIAYSAVKIRHTGVKRWSMETGIHVYFLNLMAFDFFQALANVLSIKWIVEFGVFEGSYCRAQGALKQFGDVGVALTSFAIAVHTFYVLVFRRRVAVWVAVLVTFLIWLFGLLAVIISASRYRNSQNFYDGQWHGYYGETRYWCWITKPYLTKEAIGLQNVWMWSTLVGNVVIYVFLGFLLGFRTVKVEQRDDEREMEVARANAVGMRLFLYPVIYIITIAPHTVSRWVFLHRPGVVPLTVTVVAGVFFSLNGFFNVVLFAFTRPRLIPNRLAEM